MRRVIVVVIVMCMASPAFADIQESAKQEGARAAREANALAAQARPNARSQNDDNPYFVPSVVLMGLGGLVALYGATHASGVECRDSVTSVSCGITKSKVTIFTGVGIAGVGAYLFHKGKVQSSPQILIGPNVIGAAHRVVW